VLVDTRSLVLALLVCNEFWTRRPGGAFQLALRLRPVLVMAALWPALLLPNFVSPLADAILVLHGRLPDPWVDPRPTPRDLEGRICCPQSSDFVHFSRPSIGSHVNSAQ
jgi:hypothetical protein